MGCLWHCFTHIISIANLDISLAAWPPCSCSSYDLRSLSHEKNTQLLIGLEMGSYTGLVGGLEHGFYFSIYWE